MMSAAIIAGLSLVGEGFEQSRAAEAKGAALDLEGKEIELQTSQKTLANYDAMQKALEAQIAHMTTTGFAFSSPSFNAIQRNTLNEGAKNQANIDIEGDIASANVEFEKANVSNTLWAQLFGDTAQAATMGYKLYNAAPKME
jgi:hypothetical protein